MTLSELKKIESRLAKAPTKKDVMAWLELRSQVLTDYLKYDADDFNYVCRIRGGIVVAEELLSIIQGAKK